MAYQPAARPKSMALRRLADGLTASRLVLAVALVALGVRDGRAAFLPATLLFMLGWTTDTIDGHLGEASGHVGSSYLSRNDVTIDVIFSVGIFSYLVISGLVPTWVGVAYLLFAASALLLFPVRSVAVALQVPAAITPFVVALKDAPPLAWLIGIWALLLLALDFRRFRWRVRAFFSGLADITNPFRRPRP